MPQLFTTQDVDFEAQFTAILTGKREQSVEVDDVVAGILLDMRTRGDAALFELTTKFDGHTIDAHTIRFTEVEIDAAVQQVSSETKAALELAAQRIEAYHREQTPPDKHWTDAQGVALGWRWSALDSVGLYVPGGTAAYPSSVLMNAIPAKVAGVPRVVMVVPTPKGQFNPLILMAARLAGVHEIYRIGGAQAVGALAYGTQSIAPVAKIVGPGNAYVAAAKRRVFGHVGIDMIAGPSEVLILADEHQNPAWVAMDLLAQAEHDVNAQSILISTNEAFIQRVFTAVDDALKTLPRAAIAGPSWAQHGVGIVVRSWEEAITLSNRLAAEHLQIMTENADELATKIRNAGAIFIGAHTPEAIGDYVGGSNHVLPTARSARFSSGLSLYDFLKRTSILKCTPASLVHIGLAAVCLAEEEGLEAHAQSVRLRLNT